MIESFALTDEQARVIEELRAAYVRPYPGTIEEVRDEVDDAVSFALLYPSGIEGRWLLDAAGRVIARSWMMTPDGKELDAIN